MDSYRVFVKLNDDVPPSYDMALFKFCTELVPVMNWFCDNAQDLLSRFMQAMVDVSNACAHDRMACGNYFNSLYHHFQFPTVPSMEVIEVITPKIEFDLQHGLIPGPSEEETYKQ